MTNYDEIFKREVETFEIYTCLENINEIDLLVRLEEILKKRNYKKIHMQSSLKLLQGEFVSFMKHFIVEFRLQDVIVEKRILVKVRSEENVFLGERYIHKEIAELMKSTKLKLSKVN